jgi:hypothetical protein
MLRAMALSTVEANRKELTECWALLAPQLYQGLVMRLQEADWYLTGVSVGLESLNAFYLIADLVYREHGASAEGTRRVARIRTVYEKFVEFANDERTPEERAKILCDVRLPLQLLLADLQGDKVGSTGLRRKPVTNQLAADINFYLLRLRSFEKMRGDLARNSSFMRGMMPGQRKRDAAEFLETFKAYSADFGFEDANVLLTSEGVKATLKKIERETRNVEARIKQVHSKIFMGRFRDLAGEDPKVDLEEAHLVPVFAKILQAGIEYTARTYNAYEHALELVGADMSLYKRVADLTLVI